MKSITNTEKRQQYIDLLRIFLEEAVKTSGLSLTQIALRGGMAPSTLTRFMDKQQNLLSSANIAAVSEVTGVSAPSFIKDISLKPQIKRGFSEKESEPYKATSESTIDAAINILSPASSSLCPFTLKSKALDYQGFKKGDILIVDLNAQPSNGDIVCVQLYNWENLAATQTVFRIFDPPFLLSSSSEEAIRKPILIDNDKIGIKGVVIAMIRSNMKQ